MTWIIVPILVGIIIWLMATREPPGYRCANCERTLDTDQRFARSLYCPDCEYELEHEEEDDWGEDDDEDDETRAEDD